MDNESAFGTIFKPKAGGGATNSMNKEINELKKL